MFAWARFEELIEALLEIDRRCAGHVIKVITLPIPRQRRSHGGAIARMKEIVRPGKVLLPCERRGRIAKVRSVIIKKFATVLARGAARERDAHRGHWLNGCCLHSDQTHT